VQLHRTPLQAGSPQSRQLRRCVPYNRQGRTSRPPQGTSVRVTRFSRLPVSRALPRTAVGTARAQRWSRCSGSTHFAFFPLSDDSPVDSLFFARYVVIVLVSFRLLQLGLNLSFVPVCPGSPKTGQGVTLIEASLGGLQSPPPRSRTCGEVNRRRFLSPFFAPFSLRTIW
jgi:hypothetical protein